MSQNFRLKNNALFVAAEAVGGFFNADQLRTVALVSESESAVLKVTEDGAIGFIIEESKLIEISETFRESGILLKHYRSTQPPAARACLGELCPKFEQDALGHSIEVAAALQQAFPDGAPFLRIGMNGCAQNCLASGTDDIHIVGESTGYKIHIGGKASEIPQLAQFLAENIPAAELGAYLRHIITQYKLEGQDGESLHDVIERSGLALFERHTAPDLDAAADIGEGSDVPPSDLNSDTLLSDSESALAEEEHVLLDPSLDSLAQADPQEGNDDSMQLLAMDESEDLPIDLLGEPDLSHATDQASGEALEEAAENFKEALAEPMESLDVGDITNALLDPADLDDGLMDLGSMDASELADLTMNPQAESDDAEALVETEQDVLMTDEISMETSDATEDDVSRVTQAMRSEAAIEQSMSSALSSASAGASLAEINALDFDNPEAADAGPLDLAAAANVEEALDDQPTASDIPQSFLELQEAAANRDALQVRLIEDIVIVRTPNGVMLNLPLQSLIAGLRIVLNLGQLPFETFLKDEKIIVRYGQMSLALPLESLIPATKDSHQKPANILNDAA